MVSDKATLCAGQWLCRRTIPREPFRANSGWEYGEVFDRNVGDGSPLKLPRGGLNALWTRDGLKYAPPIR